MSKKKEQTTDFNRRDFLRGGSFATLMMMLGGVEISAAEADKKKAAAEAEKKPIGPPVKCGIIGVGTWGRELIGHLSRLPNAPIVSVCETYPASLRRASSAAPKAEGVNDYRKVLDNKEVEAVIIATPTHQHKEIVLAALQAGKHVYCEAPMAASLEDAKAIAQAAKAATKQIFQVGLQYRANPQHRHVVEFARTGATGTIATVRGQFHKKESWRRTSPNPDREKELNWRLQKDISAGLIGELGIHSLDAASWMLRSQPVSVIGYGDVMHWKDGRNVPDTIHAIVEFDHGVRQTYEATLTNSYDGNYDVYCGTDSAIVVRENRAWMFKETDSPLLGWEVYARKDNFFGSGETGIALVANATKLIALGLKPAENAADSDSPVYYSLEEFIGNINDKKAPSAGYKEGLAAAVTVIKANEAILKGTKITFDKAWFEV